MSVSEYRISKSREEIVKLVQKKFEAETTMTIWQKDPKTQERSFKCEVKFASIDIFEGVFSIAINDIDKAHFNTHLETYFLLQVQDFVFKTRTSIVHAGKNGSLTFQIPHDVRLKELRIHPRVYIDQEEKRFVAAKFNSKDNDEAQVNVACPIYNISKSGICIIVSKETLSSVKLNEAIALEGLSFFESLGNEMKAVIKNARVHTKRGYGKDEYYALGLEFQQI
ncbi:hypothetical protein SHI21_04365 [Bacteriovorax sp. PP10]|uniref:PilZ domain-containing protein n=1 Tax=Bacteriovorax antarcticus TaxID=3088717 RepID=A0ABU5VQV1_9BACT|nr:hypothetical protein [Bacteriovorax sp. PP10]MEA9355416.1 hypothetical protein [Bacteriovorax sp. PP10]